MRTEKLLTLIDDPVHFDRDRNYEHQTILQLCYKVVPMANIL